MAIAGSPKRSSHRPTFRNQGIGSSWLSSSSFMRGTVHPFVGPPPSARRDPVDGQRTGVEVGVLVVVRSARTLLVE
jgi:hypothetical protein